MQNSTYNCDTWNQVQASAIQANNVGITKTCAANTNTNIDYQLTDDVFFRGVQLIAQNVNFGDMVNMQVIDTNGVTGVSPGTVIATPVVNWNLESSTTQLVLDYESLVPVKLLATMTLRVIYSSTSLLTPVNAELNYIIPKLKF